MVELDEQSVQIWIISIKSPVQVCDKLTQLVKLIDFSNNLVVIAFACKTFQNKTISITARL